MNILVIHQFHICPKEAGITRFNQFAEIWARQGHKIEIIAGMINYLTGKKAGKYKKKLFVKEKEGKNTEVLRVFSSSVGYRNFGGRFFSYFSFTISALIAGLFFSKKPDVVIATSPPLFAGPVGYLISIFKRVPFVFEIRDLWPDEAVEMGVLKNKLLIKLSYALEKFLYKKAKLIIALSPGFKEFLTKNKGISSENIKVIPNPVDLNLLRPSAKNKCLNKKFGWQDKFIILYAGAHSMVYDFKTILKTAKKLKDKKDILFVFIGDGRQKPSLIKSAKKDNLFNVQFLKPVPKEQITDFINSSDICLATLKKLKLLDYVYATKLFDYMACAKPIILAMDGVSRNLVVNQAQAGIFVEPGNSTAFRKVLLYLLDHPRERKILGDNGYQFVKKNFSGEKLASQYEKILVKLVKM